ncbi:calcium uniporter protein 2, mitochondrial-like [Phalaenopsis equestris]|uniref:calcium uniporter protein 2, mitochondrial-like n=1 Tax=Phalaenopsis equestris TaxID=78828 RepID=UPI0009E1A679|nr:calcium uniporter protein 2, mitochondrial-like [Phalaenopsis equestris]
MALRKMVSGRFLHLIKQSSSRAALPPPPPDLRQLLPSSTCAGSSKLRIVLQQRSISQSGATVPPTSIRNTLPIGDNLIERIRTSMMQDRTQIDSFPPPLPVKEEKGDRSGMAISVENLRKLLMASRIEAARAKLRGIPCSYVGYSEFAEICREAAAGSEECAREIAGALEHSGAVIVLTDVVFLRPEQVARAIESMIGPQNLPGGAEDVQAKELKDMEAVKAAIDKKAEAQVKRELWAGLGVLLIQTAGFMRLTFWELSWDVMEPICFFTTSVYFMLGYAFFLRTAKEPSFEGFFSSRFAAKQKRLMKSHSFDLSKLNELKRAPTIVSHACKGSAAH